MNRRLTRRRFLKRACATGAAVGLFSAHTASARDAEPPATHAALVDTHVYLGHWPHQRLTGVDAPDLVARLHSDGVTTAWVGSFDGLFHKDIGAVNQRLADVCREPAAGRLHPLGSVNPTLPDWEEDVRRCHDVFHMPGIRLHPHYHGYALDDPRFARLLELASARGLVVHLVAWLEDDQHRWLNPAARHVDLAPLTTIAGKFEKLKLVVAGAPRALNDESLTKLLALKQLHTDFAGLVEGRPISRLISQAAQEQVVFGSGAPLHRPQDMLARLYASKLTQGQQQSIAFANAARLVGARNDAVSTP